MTEPIHPDAAAAIISWLGDGIGALHDQAATAHRAVPNPRPTRFLTVYRTGGVRRSQVSDAPHLTVDAWGADEDDAHDLALAARALLHRARGQVIDGVTVYSVTELAGPAQLPDPDSEQPRYRATYEVHVRGYAGS